MYNIEITEKEMEGLLTVYSSVVKPMIIMACELNRNTLEGRKMYRALNDTLKVLERMKNTHDNCPF